MLTTFQTKGVSARSKTEPVKSKTEPVESRTEQTTEPVESKTEQTIGTEADVVRLDGFGYLQKHKASTLATTPGPQLPTTRNGTNRCTTQQHSSWPKRRALRDDANIRGIESLQYCCD